MNTKRSTNGRFNKETILRFLDKQGFYIVLFACALIVASTALFTTNAGKSMLARIQGKSQASDLAANDPQPTPTDMLFALPEEDDTAAVGITEQETVEDALEAARANKPTPAPTAPQLTETPTVTPIPVRMEWPVTGQMGMTYGTDVLVYSKTLDQWTTHTGVDILAAAGTPVLCVLDGVVSEVRQDTAYGYMVRVAHGEWETVYASLKDNPACEAGQKVSQGQVLGQVGLSATFESEEAPHLHFEVYRDGRPVDPVDLLENAGS